MKYLRRQTMVDAIQWTGDNYQEILDFTGVHIFCSESTGVLEVPSNCCNMCHVIVGDFIVRDECNDKFFQVYSEDNFHEIFIG